jgi:hypothetical protein
MHKIRVFRNYPRNHRDRVSFRHYRHHNGFHIMWAGPVILMWNERR